ncbi:sterol homeostasis protein [Entomophthora muscae]|uniref:Sterol homeostasis protein n=1 Tax=Entomophthora muscae TaxID=34485 RepID=A0ACC2TB92_9FUNG|nr:sterol homeostasis protein [Entomophthora muscae]
MPVCVECGHSISKLVNEYGQGNIVLKKCSICDRFADKYLEHEGIVIFIDLLLHKPQVYRHILFNRIQYYDTGLPKISNGFSLNKPAQNEDALGYIYLLRSSMYSFFY